MPKSFHWMWIRYRVGFWMRCASLLWSLCVCLCIVFRSFWLAEQTAFSSRLLGVIDTVSQFTFLSFHFHREGRKSCLLGGMYIAKNRFVPRDEVEFQINYYFSWFYSCESENIQIRCEYGAFHLQRITIYWIVNKGVWGVTVVTWGSSSRPVVVVARHILALIIKQLSPSSYNYLLIRATTSENNNNKFSVVSGKKLCLT